MNACNHQEINFIGKFETIAFKSQAHAGPKQRERHLPTTEPLLGDHQQIQQSAIPRVAEMETATMCRAAAAFAAAPEKKAKADSPFEWAHVLCAARVDRRRRHDAPPASHCKAGEKSVMIGKCLGKLNGKPNAGGKRLALHLPFGTNSIT